MLHLGHWQEGVAELREMLRREPGNEKVRAALKEALAHPSSPSTYSAWVIHRRTVSVAIRLPPPL